MDRTGVNIKRWEMVFGWGDRGAARRGTSERERSRKRRAGGFSSRWSDDDDDVADDLPSAPWQVGACTSALPANTFSLPVYNWFSTACLQNW